MPDPTQFRIGGVPLDPRRFNKESLDKIHKAAEAAEPTEGKEEVLATLKELRDTGEVPTDSFDGIYQYQKQVKEEYYSDNDRFWDTYNSNGKNFKDPTIIGIKNEIGASGSFLGKYDALKDSLRESTALAAVQGLAGGSFGPTGVVAGYAAWANGSNWNGTAQKNTAELVETYNQFLSGDSRMISEGNSVQQVHREELWRALGTMTADAKASGEAGNPLPITAQYYELTSPEMIGNLAGAAKAGSKLRLNLDPGRLSYPSKDRETKKNYFETDDIPDKMRTILQFTQIEGADVGVSIFPMEQELGNPEDLMHRKILRVGDKVLMSGMNANMGSGENIDAGYIIEGPGASKLTENLVRDIGKSTGVGLEEIWGADHIEKFRTEDLRMGQRGITALLDGLAGPGPAGTDRPSTKNLGELEALAKKAGVDLKTMFDVSPEKYEATLGAIAQGKGEASLSTEGKEKLLSLIGKAVAATQTEKNKAALGDIDLPSDKKVGKTRVDIADLPAEREVLTINAISEAEEFVYLPGFVVTRAVAGAIVAKKEEMEAQGKTLDVRVIADSGIYPDGGTPNTWGVNFLEDHGVPTKWSKLTRTGSHDRKIHAKQLLTDKGEIAGSTNFSNKGMKENWETSAYVHFEADDKDAIALRDASKKQFEDLWDNDCYDLSSTDYSASKNSFAHPDAKEWATAQGRNARSKEVIAKIQDYEVETGKLVSGFMANPDYKAVFDGFVAKGYSEGDAAILAADKHFGVKEFREMRNNLPTNQELVQLEKKVENWKARYGGKE